MASEVRLRLAVEGGQAARREIEGVNASVGDLATAGVTAAKAMAGVFTGFAASQTIGKLISVQREFDVLNSSLITVTGSSANAAREMAWIKTFAKETPFGLAQATQGFVKMKALGLDPTRASLTSFGNTASAMGKDLNQMVEAVADASTGEFERLKEFGIKARTQGDQVSLTFQGVTTTIGNSAREITGYLEDLGNNQFAGAMAERAQTLDGAIAGLGDTWDELFRTVNTNNTGGFIFDSVTLATKAIEDATTMLNALSGAADGNAKSTGAMATVQEALAVAFETVAVLGANVKYVLVQVGTEIGGLAAQAVQILQGNFSAAAAIRTSMVADAKAARAEIDATTARILSARKDATAAAAVNATASARLARQGVADADATVAAQTRVATSVKKVSDAQKEAAKAQAVAHRILLANAAEHTKMVDDAIDADEKALALVNDQIKTARTLAEQIEFETRLLGLNAEQRAIASAERELERQGIVAGTLAYDAYIAKIRQALAAKTARQADIDNQTAAEKAAKDLQDANQTAAEASEKFWEDALMRAFESGKGFFESLWDTIKNTLKTQVLKVGVQAVMGSLGLGAAGAVNAGSGGVLGDIGAASNLAGLYNGVSSLVTVGGQVAAGTMSAANALGTIAANATNTGISGLLATNGAYGTAAGAAGSAGSAIATAGPYIAAAMALYALHTMSQGETRSGGQYGYSATNADGAQLLHAPSGGDFAADKVKPAIDTTVAYTNDLLKKLGSTAAIATFQAAYQTSEKNRGGVLAGGTLTSGATFGESGAGSEYRGDRYDPSYGFELNAEEAVKYFAYDLQAATIEALQAATDLDAGLADKLSGYQTRATTLTKEAIEAKAAENAALLAQINTVISFTELAKTLPFGNLKDLSFDAAAGLLQLAGGLDALSANLSTYYDKFYSDEEKLAQTITNIGTTLRAAGADIADADIAGATREQFRAAVEGQDLSTEAGQRLYAALLSVAGAFDQVKTGAEAAAQAAQRAAAEAASAWTRAMQDAASAFAGIWDATLASAQDALSQAESDLRAAYNAQVSALREQASAGEAALREQASAWDQIKQQFSNFADSLAGQFETPAQSMLRLRAEYQRLTDLARLGDADAAGQAVGVGGQLAKAIAGSTSTSTEAALAVARLRVSAAATADLAAKREIAATQAAEALKASIDAQINALTQQVGQYITLTDAVLSVEEAIAAFQGAQAALDRVRNDYLRDLTQTVQTDLLPSFGRIDTNLDALISQQEFLTAFDGFATEDTLKAVFSTLDVNGDGQISLLESIKASGLDTVAALQALKITATTGAQYTGKEVVDAINNATAGGLTAAQVVDAANYNYGITPSTVVAVAAAAANSPATTTPAVQAVVAEQAKVDAQKVLSASEKDAFVKAVTAHAAGLNISAERALYDLAHEYGYSAAMVDKAMGWPYGTSNNWARANGLPTFAQGADYLPQDMLAQVHKGERIIPAADNAALIERLQNPQANSEALVAEIRALREENRAQAAAMVRLQQDLYRLHKRWDATGLPEVREVAA